MTPEQLKELAADLGRYSRDPLGWLYWAFPWGVPGGPLADKAPDTWHVEHMDELGAHLQTAPFKPYREAVASGHGIGKSADMAWMILWSITTAEDTRGVVTANTMDQLTKKTWAELAKWYALLIPELKELFTLTATAIYSSIPGREKTWRIDATPWSETNTEAFAGLHNQGKRIFVGFDEASAISDKIWEVTEGALTDSDTEIVWTVRGNPTRNTGRFRECFSRFKHLWNRRQVDSRTVRITNKEQLAEWAETYGEDSDFMRVRVRGLFPRAGSTQLIPTDVAEAALTREVGYIATDPLVMGVDVARFGDDRSVIRFRRGRDARSIPPIKFQGLDTMQLAGRVAQEARACDVDTVFVDVTGLGVGVYDRLCQLGVINALGEPVNLIPVNFSSAGGVVTFDGVSVKAANKRAAMWCSMREWLKLGGIEDDQSLADELAAVEYGYNTDNAVQLERKEDLKKRLGWSPDDGDALALTFAEPVAPKALAVPTRERVNPYAAFQIPRSSPSHGGDYDIYADL